MTHSCVAKSSSHWGLTVTLNTWMAHLALLEQDMKMSLCSKISDTFLYWTKVQPATKTAFHSFPNYLKNSTWVWVKKSFCSLGPGTGYQYSNFKALSSPILGILLNYISPVVAFFGAIVLTHTHNEQPVPRSNQASPPCTHQFPSSGNQLLQSGPPTFSLTRFERLRIPETNPFSIGLSQKQLET